MAKRRHTWRRSASTTTRTKSQEKWDHEEYAEIIPRSELEESAPLDGQPDPGGTTHRPPSMRGFFDARHTRAFAASSTLPDDFFIDVHDLQTQIEDSENDPEWSLEQHYTLVEKIESSESQQLGAQVKLLESVRELESKLTKARADLQASVARKASTPNPLADKTEPESMTLTKEDYKGLVDLYHYTHMRRFGPDAPDHSPTPLLLQDYAFKMSEDFGTPDAFAKYYIDDENYESPLKAIEDALRSKQLREIAVMQAFVDLLVDDQSSNRALHDIYLKLPSPGVAYLPTSLIRLFLQRMSTPWTKSEKSMLRYLSLIDDMQRANLPISRSEWSSAIYLAGRSFARVTSGDMRSAFKLWRQMEHEAGVESSHVTFNILFDIAVRAGKYPIAQSLLKEMHERGLKLNRLGRVSLIYYYGLRGDGDSVRKAYRDFVDAGEIVDTLVLNCVIAALLNAQEPTAAEQIYERMKNLQQRFQLRQRPDGSETLYLRYPHGGHAATIDRELASNSLGRVLLRASQLKSKLPEHHSELQSVMPLTPNLSTFRSMISYHANVSGNLNRLTVLMNEMIEVFNLPFQSVNFQVLFKGFALHGTMGDPDCTWNLNRLNLAWDACRNSIKEAQAARRASRETVDVPKPTLSTVNEVEAADLSSESLLLRGLPKRKKLSTWDDFVVDLAVFPRQRRRDIERVHTQLFDDELLEARKFHNPFFQQRPSPPSSQETYYPLGLGHTKLDHEEGEYTLPSPVEAIAPEDPNAVSEYPDQRAEDTKERRQEQVDTESPVDEEEERPLPHEIRATRPLICWLLRAYARCSGDRDKVEEVWNSARKIWRPIDEFDKQSVYRVLRRCLRDCDRYGDHKM